MDAINDAQERLLRAAGSGVFIEVYHLTDIDGVDIETKNYRGETPLSRAAYFGHLGVVEFLIGLGADVETRTNDGQTPLFGAAINGHLKMVEFLADHGANVETKDRDGQTPVEAAADCDNVEVVEFLKEVIAQRQRRFDTAANVGIFTKSAARR